MYNLPDQKKKVWDFKTYQESEWFRMLVIMLIVLSLIYTLLHLFINNYGSSKSGYEYSKIDKIQMDQINRIYFDTSSIIKTNNPTSPKDTLLNKKVKQNNISDAAKGSKKADSASNVSAPYLKGTVITDSCKCSRYNVSDKAISYLNNQFNNKIDPVQVDSIRNYLYLCSSLEATAFLSNIRLQVRSYFWLTGPAVYFEIIFWAWFGVICSLLFNLGVIGKNSTTNPLDKTTYFDSSEIPYQVAKLLYAPACTLIIVLGYNFFNDQNIVDISSSKGVIVFAFIAGFYSSRLIAFLDKLKELMLPVSSAEAKSSDTGSLKNLVVQVQLNNSIAGMWASVKNDAHLLNVTLQKDEYTQKGIALNDEDQFPLYIFDYVKPGTYILKASLDTKVNDKEIILNAEQKIEMKNTDQTVTLKLIDASGEEDIPATSTGTTPETETQVDIDINKKSGDNE